MPDRPWWKRWDGLPWENEPDADERTSFFDRSLTAQVAKLIIALVVVTFGIAVSLVGKRAWRAGLIWATIGVALAYGSNALWRKLRVGRR